MVILTHNRPERLQRVLNYYSSHERNLKIIVADSSSTQIKIQNQKTISLFSSLDISYLHDYSPKDDIMVRFLRKIAEAVDQVTEEYSLICPDDGFITPRGIGRSIDFLEEHSDFTVAHGHYIAFCREGRERFLWKPIYPYRSITFPNARDRLLFHLSNYMPTTVGVHRTEFLRMIYKETVKFTDDLRFCELLPSALTLIHGKMKSLNDLYAAFEYMPTSLGETTETLGDFIRANTFYRKYQKFRHCLAMHLSESSELNEAASKKAVDAAMSAYLSTYWYSIQGGPAWRSIPIRKIEHIFRRLSLGELIWRRIRQTGSGNVWASRDPPADYCPDFNEIRRLVIDQERHDGK